MTGTSTSTSTPTSTFTPVDINLVKLNLEVFYPGAEPASEERLGVKITNWSGFAVPLDRISVRAWYEHNGPMGVVSSPNNQAVYTNANVSLGYVAKPLVTVSAIPQSVCQEPGGPRETNQMGAIHFTDPNNVVLPANGGYMETNHGPGIVDNLAQFYGVYPNQTLNKTLDYSQIPSAGTGLHNDIHYTLYFDDILLCEWTSATQRDPNSGQEPCGISPCPPASTATNTSSATGTSTMTPTKTGTSSSTVTSTNTVSSTWTSLASSTSTATASPTMTASNTPTPTFTDTPLSTSTPTDSASPTSTATPSGTMTYTATLAPPTATFTPAATLCLAYSSNLTPLGTAVGPVAAASTGNIYRAAQNTVTEYTSIWGIITQWNLAANALANAIAVDTNNDVYVLETVNNGTTYQQIEKFSANGTPLWAQPAVVQQASDPAGLGYPTSMGVAPNGNVYLPIGGIVRVFNAAGVLQSPDIAIGGMMPGNPIAVDSFGTLYIGDQNYTITEYDATGAVQFSFPVSSSGRSSQTIALAIGPGGNIYNLNYRTRQFEIFDKAGDLLYASSYSFQFTIGLAVDSSGSVYISDSGLGTIYKFAVCGTLAPMMAAKSLVVSIGHASTTATATSTPTATVTATCTPTSVVLAQGHPVIYPNPVTGGTATVGLTTLTASKVKVHILTLAGHLVKTKEYSQVTTGSVSIDLTDKNGLQLANGLYYLKVNVDDQTAVCKMLVLR
jgi:hypothetical protein